MSEIGPHTAGRGARGGSWGLRNALLYRRTSSSFVWLAAAELDRLEKMAGKDMKPELQTWMARRKNILKKVSRRQRTQDSGQRA